MTFTATERIENAIFEVIDNSITEKEVREACRNVIEVMKDWKRQK